MKKLTFILVATVMLASISCKKTNDTEDITYTVKYSVVSTGDVTVDSIIYVNSSGAEVLLLDQNQFAQSFESVNSYHGKLFVSGTTTNGSCAHSVQILRGEGIIKDNSSVSESNVPIWFQYLGEFLHTQN